MGRSSGHQLDARRARVARRPRAPASPVRRSSSGKTSRVEEHRGALPVPVARARRSALAARASRCQQRRDDGGRQPRLVAERDERRRRTDGAERGDARRDRAACPSSGAGFTAKRTAMPVERGAHDRRRVGPGHAPRPIVHAAGQRRPRRSSGRRACRQHQEQLAPPHAPREPGGEHDPRDHRARRQRRRPRPEGLRGRELRGGRYAHPSRRYFFGRGGRLDRALGEDAAEVRSCTRPSPAGRPGRPRPRPPSRPPPAMVAASSVLPVSAASTPLARTALVPAPVIADAGLGALAAVDA